ncbi:MAG TPA: hypothetical protein VEA69_07000 [Tepidisphaeraceae bacterium]|nr:hypothetical protein [Tepidisphaeraceae bacterium]
MPPAPPSTFVRTRWHVVAYVGLGIVVAGALTLLLLPAHRTGWRFFFTDMFRAVSQWALVTGSFVLAISGIAWYVLRRRDRAATRRGFTVPQPPQTFGDPQPPPRDAR